MKNVLPYIGRKYDDTHAWLQKDNTSCKMLSRKWLTDHFFPSRVFLVICLQGIYFAMYVPLSLLSAMSKYFQWKRKQRRDNLNKLLNFWLPSRDQDRPTWCHLLFYFTSYVLNMFRTLIYTSSGACDYSVELPHWSYCSWFDVCWSFGVIGLEWYLGRRLNNVDHIRS